MKIRVEINNKKAITYLLVGKLSVCLSSLMSQSHHSFTDHAAVCMYQGTNYFLNNGLQLFLKVGNKQYEGRQ